MSIKVTTIIGDNYGSALQAYGFQCSLKKVGGGSDLVWVRPRSYVVRFLRMYFIPTATDGIKKKLRKLSSDFANRAKRRKVKEFYRTSIKMSCYRNRDALAQDCKSGDILICGSDQVWNPQFIPNMLFYLDFAHVSGIRRYSYAASLAVDNLQPSQEDYYKKYLMNFDGISVREESGRKILEELEISDVRVDVDPVLLITREEWTNVASNRFKNEKYVLLYMLRPMNELFDYARQYAEKHGSKLVYIGDFVFKADQVENCYDAGVEDFLSAIYYADSVITNSFHATVFSTIFHKKFLSYAVTRTGSRVRDYLESISLGEHLLTNLNEVGCLIDETDWKTIDELLDKRRDDSLDYLRRIVTDSKV